jgi:hypothetical protein
MDDKKKQKPNARMAILERNCTNWGIVKQISRCL